MRLRGLRTWLVLLVLVAAAPGVALVLREHWATDEQFERDIRTDAVRMAHAVAAAERAKLEDAHGFVAALAEFPAVRALDAEGCSRIVRTLRDRYPAFANVGATTAEGLVFCSAVTSARPIDLHDRVYIQRALAGRAPAVGEYVVGRFTGLPSLHVSAPVLDAAGRPIAVVYSGMDLRTMADRLNTLGLPDHAVAAVLDRRGVILGATGPLSARAGRPPGPEALGLLRADDGAAVEGPGLDGRARVSARLGVSLSSREPDLVVVAGIDPVPLRAERRAKVGRTLAVYALAVLGGALVAWFLGDFVLVRRLAQLGLAARRVTEGDLSARTGVRSSDEIGALARTFDGMAAALERLKNQDRLILESAGIGICGVGPDLAVTVLNQAAAAMLGCSPAEAIGRSVHELLQHAPCADGSMGGVGCPIAAALADGATLQRGKGTGRRAGGAAFPIEFAVTPVRDAGIVRFAVVTFHDVSERRQLESQLLHAQKMEAIGRLAGGLAHDLNNVLTAVLSIGCSLQEGLPADHPQQPEAAELVTAGRRAGELTRQLLAFSRKQVLAPHVLDPNQVIRDVDRMLARMVGENVSVRLTLRSTAPVLADRGQLEQVITNLVVNARDAMPDGGTIDVRTADARRGADARDGFDAPPGDYVLLEVSDTGVGMDEETLSRAFEPFFTTKAPSVGTGLGLSTVYGIVKQSGGAIRAESAPGRGACFGILLPRRDSGGAAREADLPPHASRTTRREKVLVVEDDTLVRAVTCRALGGAGYRVVEAASAEDALMEIPSGDPIDMVVTDVLLPGVNGRELAAQLRTRWPSVKILFVSGYVGETNVKGLEGTRGFLQKPYTPDELLRRVRELLDDPLPDPEVRHANGGPPRGPSS